jgi:predicted nucleic acid-binding protein
MRYLLDTGILLRLVDENDPQHGLVCDAVDVLIRRRDDLLITVQNIAEFWNVATRSKANNGLELSPTEVAQLFQLSIDPIVAVLVEQATLRNEFQRVLIQYNVVGKQVHDARLAAMMLNWQVDHILTLNGRNFQRFTPEGIFVITPADLIAANP